MGDITARGHPESEPLPWIEDPHALVRGPTDTPKPAGFGPWPENAWHRIAHAGTYDDQWRKTRSPLPPKDFHPRYFNCAHPQLQLDAPPAPGCQVRAINLSAAPLADFSVPEIHLEVTAARRGISRSWPLHMDTLTLDTEAREISLRWSAGIPIPADTEPALRLGLGSGRPT
jgi:hypothetical protein